MEMDQREVFSSCADGETESTEIGIHSQEMLNDFSNHSHGQNRIRNSQQPLGYQE
jgi:hypothetical protein